HLCRAKEMELLRICEKQRDDQTYLTHSVDLIFISLDWRERDRSSISSLSRQGIQQISPKSSHEREKAALRCLS
ncbi:MAG: hypothetical protein IJQ69_02130, partial [Bacteroidales bacterium]|nr:hypothetical protein [Bacteroidales bacterium]